jgi:hypothetical protein
MMNQGPDAMTAAAVIAVLMVPHPALWLITQPLTQTQDPITASSYSDVAAYQHQRYLQIFHYNGTSFGRVFFFVWRKEIVAILSGLMCPGF